jgi:hypothetical protein
MEEELVFRRREPSPDIDEEDEDDDKDDDDEYCPPSDNDDDGSEAGKKHSEGTDNDDDDDIVPTPPAAASLKRKRQSIVRFSDDQLLHDPEDRRAEREGVLIEDEPVDGEALGTLLAEMARNPSEHKGRVFERFYGNPFTDRLRVVRGGLGYENAAAQRTFDLIRDECLRRTRPYERHEGVMTSRTQEADRRRPCELCYVPGHYATHALQLDNDYVVRAGSVCVRLGDALANFFKRLRHYLNEYQRGEAFDVDDAMTDLEQLMYAITNGNSNKTGENGEMAHPVPDDDDDDEEEEDDDVDIVIPDDEHFDIDLVND